MIKYFTLVFIVIVSSGSLNCQKPNRKETDKPFIHSQTVHPRLLLEAGGEEQIKKAIGQNAGLQKVNQAIMDASNGFLTAPLLKRELVGKRLLGVSRECLRRVFFLSFAYRMTKDDRYLKRAEAEMINVSGFSDWNPSHFLDVAEMTFGLAIGYDWLYNQLPKSSLATIKAAIIEKGIEPSFSNSGTWWIKGTNNWSQVCHAGMSFGAIAVYEDYREKAELVLQRAVDNLPIVMNMYNPDGAYPEGYGYWGYGTNFNVLFIDAWQKFKQKKYDFSGLDGFLKTPSFMLNMVGPSNQNFNFSDGGSGLSIQPAMYWFAKNENDVSFIFNDKKYIENSSTTKLAGERQLPALLIWAKDLTDSENIAPSKTFWKGDGENPVVMMRTSWTDPDAIYLGFKCGTPSASHAHMDIGSFVLDAEGVRWASDYGMQDYNSLESKGVDLWNMKQNSQRWTVFRYNNLAHNTLSFNNQYQLVAGHSIISSSSSQNDFMNVTTDLSSVYDGQIEKSQRGAAIIDGKYVVIRDEVKANQNGTKLRWTLMTLADVSILNGNSITLTKGGKKMIIKIQTDQSIQIKTWSTTSSNSYDAPNPGTTLVGFETDIQPNKTADFNVFFIPEKNLGMVTPAAPALSAWPKN